MIKTRRSLSARITIWLIALLASPVTSAGACESSVLNIEGATVQVFTSRALGQDVDCQWSTWIEQSVASVASISGRFPVGRVSVYLDRSEGSQPVAYGWIRRNLPPEVHLKVYPAATLEELLNDWHGYHEFAHLLLPFVGNRDIWFAEGLASYYQHFLQARSGAIDGDQAWERLTAGFQRGLDDPAGRGESLSLLSPKMWSERAFRRVYWTGAAFFMRVDYRLRMASDGQHSLDTSLAAFQACCMPGSEGNSAGHSARSTDWNAASLIAELGKLSLNDIWQEEYQRTIDQLAEPDFGEAGKFLGLEIQSGQVVMKSGNPYRDRRASLAMGRDFDPAGQAALNDELEEISRFFAERGSTP